MIYRQFQDGDALKLASLFYSTIHEINIQDYTPEQVDAWAPPLSTWDMGKWDSSFKNKFIVVAEDKTELAGFGELEPNGHIDRFYISKNFIGKGVGKEIYSRLEKEALKNFLPELFVEASITAKPFFEKLGFVVQKRQQVERRGVLLTNYVMTKMLVKLV